MLPTDKQTVCLWGRLNLIAFPGELEKTKNHIITICLELFGV
jgi:hypothetical protein